MIDIYIRWNILPITAKTLSWPHTPVSHAITNCYFQQRQNHSKTMWHHLSTAPNCSCLLTLPPWLWKPDIYHLTPPTSNTNVNVSDVMLFFSHFSVMFAQLLDWQNRIGACVPTWEKKIWQLGRKETKIAYFIRLLGFDNVHHSSLMETHRTLRRCWVLQEDAILSTRSFIH